jgi:hypothetical protein
MVAWRVSRSWSGQESGRPGTIREVSAPRKRYFSVAACAPCKTSSSPATARCVGTEEHLPRQPRAVRRPRFAPSASWPCISARFIARTNPAPASLRPTPKLLTHPPFPPCPKVFYKCVVLQSLPVCPSLAGFSCSIAACVTHVTPFVFFFYPPPLPALPKCFPTPLQ